MTATMMTRLTRNAKMAEGILTIDSMTSLTYTDLMLMAFRIREGRHGEDCCGLKVVSFDEFLETSNSVPLIVVFILLLEYNLFACLEFLQDAAVKSKKKKIEKRLLQLKKSIPQGKIFFSTSLQTFSIQGISVRKRLMNRSQELMTWNEQLTYLPSRYHFLRPSYFKNAFSSAYVTMVDSA